MTTEMQKDWQNEQKESQNDHKKINQPQRLKNTQTEILREAKRPQRNTK